MFLYLSQNTVKPRSEECVGKLNSSNHSPTNPKRSEKFTLMYDSTPTPTPKKGKENQNKVLLYERLHKWK